MGKSPRGSGLCGCSLSFTYHALSGFPDILSAFLNDRRGYFAALRKRLQMQAVESLNMPFLVAWQIMLQGTELFRKMNHRVKMGLGKSHRPSFGGGGPHLRDAPFRFVPLGISGTHCLAWLPGENG